MDNNYYTPTVEDFRVGFEYDLWSPLTEGFIAFKTSSGSSFNGRWENNIIRVPFLTKEAIEADGWVEEVKSDNWTSFIKNNKEYMFYNFNSKTLNIEGKIYNANCRCINDFRLIIKLLGL